MILSDRSLREALEGGRLVVEPLDDGAIQPASIDLRLDSQFRVFHNSRYAYIDVKQPMEGLTELVEVKPDDVFILHPGEFVLAATYERVAIAPDLAARLEGKALDVDTPIRTARGWTTMGALQVGETVFDEHGQSCTVVAVSEVMEDRPCWEVAFSDGETIVADGDHEWITWDVNARKSFDYHHGHPCASFPMNWATWQSRSASRHMYSLEERTRIAVGRAQGRTAAAIGAELGRTAIAINQQRRRSPVQGGWRMVGPRPVRTLEIATSVRKRGQHNHLIPVAGSLKLPKAPLPLDPWILGYLLGDGDTSGAGRVACHPEDRRWVIEQFESAGLDVRPHSDAGHFGVSGVGTLWRSLRLNAGKHVPAMYLDADAAQRLAIVQGLIDSDGSVDNHGCYRFTNTNWSLVAGFVELVRSLGRVPRVHERRGRQRRGLPSAVSWDVTVASSEPLARLPRKRHAARHEWGREQSARYITSVDQVPSRPVRCIQVNSPNGLFLAGRGFIPTHNSSLGRLGLLAHSTAGFLDPGFEGHVTLELSNVANLPITLYPGMRIGQIAVYQLTTPADQPYGSAGIGSRYQGQRGPTPSRYWKSFGPRA